MSEVRQRKPVASPAEAAPKQEAEDRSKTKTTTKPSEPDLEPNIFVLSGLFILFTLVVGGFLFYKVDGAQNGDFARWVNEKYPIVNEYLHGKSKPAFGAAAQETAGQLSLTEAELKEYDGTDSDKPIYLAINGTIFDVSAAPSFYGPGGHYHHFVGKDATRAWVTECWDTDDQFTWRMEGVEVMFLPKYLDEMFEDLAAGNLDSLEDDADDTLKMMPRETLAQMATQAVKKLGKVSAKEKAQRRIDDQAEAEKRVQETLTRWVGFFAGNAKYTTVGRVILDDDRPTPPVPCKAAFKKREMKNGKLEKMMGSIAKLAGTGGAEAGKGHGVAGDKKGEMPAFLKQKLEEKTNLKGKEEPAKEAAEDVHHGEL